MSGSDGAGLLVGFLGALIGLYFPEIIIGIVGLFVFSRISLFVMGRFRVFWEDSGRNIFDQLDSRCASWYYRNRVRVLVWLGRIDSR